MSTIDIIVLVIGILIVLGIIAYLVYQFKFKKKNPFKECDCCSAKNKNKILDEYHKTYNKD